MSTTYSDWTKVPTTTERQIRKFWNGSGTASRSSGFDRNGDAIEIYKLESYKVADNLEYLNDAQKLKLFDLAADRSFILANLLHSLDFGIETVRVQNEIYHLPGLILGTWPHCKCYGCMDETGYIHT